MAFLVSAESVSSSSTLQTLMSYNDSTVEDLFFCAVVWSKTCSFFCQEFLSLGLELVEDNSEHDLAGMAD